MLTRVISLCQIVLRKEYQMLHAQKNIHLFQHLKISHFWLGLVLIALIAGASEYISTIGLIHKLGLSTLTIAILLGIFIGNTVFPKISTQTDSGVDFSKNTLLRLGIILYGFRITFQEVSAVGIEGLITAIIMVTCTFTLAMLLGVKVFKLDKQTVMLIGAGSSICGAAAVMAAEPVIKGQAHKVSVAVATVVVFGTIAMFLYPILFPYLNLSEKAYGVFTGSTIHEVAQVVVAGNAISSTASSTAVIEKMLRVMLLAPFLVILSFSLSRKGKSTDKAKITIPWFAVFFIVVTLFNSLISLPQPLLNAINELDTLLLTMAMAALGVRTNLGAIRQAGIKPLLLAGSLFIFLIIGGYTINLGVDQFFNLLS